MQTEPPSAAWGDLGELPRADVWQGLLVGGREGGPHIPKEPQIKFLILFLKLGYVYNYCIFFLFEKH